MSKDMREWEEVAHPGFVAIFTASDRNVFVKNASTHYLYTPNATFDSHYGNSRLVHGISVGGAVVLVTCLNSIRCIGCY